MGTLGFNAKDLLQYLLTIKPKKVILNGDNWYIAVWVKILAKIPYEAYQASSCLGF